jgi:hypothetical protein
MKQQLRAVRGFVILFALSTASSLCAQSVPVDAPGDSAREPVETNTAAQDAVNNSGRIAMETFGAGAAYVPALNGAGLISIEPSNKPRLSYGYNFGAGWDDDSNGDSSGLFTASPYLAIQSSVGRTRYLVQYDPTFTKYTTSNYASGTLQSVSAALLGSLNPRWQWSANLNETYGQDSLRLVAPVQTVPVGEVPAAGPNSAVYRANAGVGEFLNLGAGLIYLKSQRDAVELQLGDSYSHFSGLSGDINLLSARLNYIHALSPTLKVTSYGQSMKDFGSISCARLGGGLGLAWQIREKTSVELAAGPEFTSDRCGSHQNLAYNAAYSSRLSEQSQIYILAGRQFSSPYLGPNLWQDSVGGGYQRRVFSTGTFNVNVNYASSEGLANGSSYRGVFVAGTYARTLRRHLNPSLSYRRIMSSTGPSNFNRDIVMFSLTWNSSFVPLFR